jgi:hypothetical protein
VAVIQVAANDPAEILDRPGVAVELARVVDEDVARLTLQQEGAHLERGRERQWLGARRVQARDHGLQLHQLLHG